MCNMIVPQCTTMSTVSRHYLVRTFSTQKGLFLGHRTFAPRIRKVRPPSKHYENLGLTEEATPTEIREAFYRKAKALHPDVNPSAGAKQEFAAVQEAFAVLKDKAKRADYDAEEDEALERTAGEKRQDIDVYMKTRQAIQKQRRGAGGDGSGKIWSERMEADLIRASMFRVARRKIARKLGIKPKKPHEFAKDRYVPLTDPDKMAFRWQRHYYHGELPEYWDGVRKIGGMAVATVVLVLGAYFAAFWNKRRKLDVQS